MKYQFAIIALLLTACGSAPSNPLTSTSETIQSVGPSFAPVDVRACSLPIVGSFTNLGNGDTMQVADDNGDCAVVIHCGGGQVTGHVVQAVGNDANFGNLTLYADVAQGNIQLMACGFANSVAVYNGVNYFKEPMTFAFVNSAWLGYIAPNEVNASSGNTWSKQ